MSASCPQCAAQDQSVPIAQALADPVAPLDPATRAVLSPPPEPQPAPAEQSAAAIVLFAIAGLLFVLGLLSMARPANLDAYSDAYRLGYRIGPFILPTLLLAIGLGVQGRSRRRQRRAAGLALYDQQTQWQQHLRMWGAGWLCRRCRVAFFPAASFRADFPASPAIPVEQLPFWVTTAAEQAFGRGALPVQG